MVLNKAFLDMTKFSFCQPLHAPSSRQQSTGFTILEVLVAVVVASGVISLLVPALIRQVSLGEQANRLTAVEAVVSRDLNWFATYATLWKLIKGTYSVSSDVTQAYSSPEAAAAAVYVPTPANCASPADSLLDDALKITATEFQPPYPVNKSSATALQVPGVGGPTLTVSRTVTPVGSKIRLSYIVATNDLQFRREASLLVEAAAWCDQLP